MFKCIAKKQERRKLRCVTNVVLVLLISIIIFMYRFNSTATKVEDVEDEYPPCGEICQYTSSGSMGQGVLYPNIKKDINCKHIMKRMAYNKHTIQYPPPRNPPDDTYDQFTQHGECPISKHMYFADFKPGTKATNKTYSYDLIDKLARSYKNNINTNRYNDQGCVLDTIKEYEPSIRGRSGVVIGTIFPWLESMLLGAEMNHITTLEYGHLYLNHSQMNVYSPYEYANLFVQNKAPLFDFGVSYSSLEHSGLGRYGDPLNPYGDLEAMAQAWCFTKPGGRFIVGVPGIREGTSCRIEWNAHRIYGHQRLQHMSANWNLIDYKQCNDSYHHILLILEKPK